MPKIKVLIVDDIAETRENIKRLLFFESDMEIAGEAKDGEEAVKLAEQLNPDVILMDINMPVLDGIAATEMISMRVPQTSIIIMSVQGEQEYLKKAMIAGAREYLVKPFSSDELGDAIRKVYNLEQKRKCNLVFEKKSIKEKGDPQIITVFSTKGGVGKSTIASNLAVSLYQQTKKKIALVDLDLQFGDIAVMLNIVPKNTITELIQEINQLDADLMESYLINHPTGIKILPAPIRPEYAELITSGHIEKILNVMKQNYDYIVIDTPAFFHETTLTALDLSTQILLLVSLELPTIKNVKLSLEVLDSLHLKGKVKMVLNRASDDIGIKCGDMERSLNFLVATQVPSDGKVVITSVNKGVPFVVTHSGTKIADSLQELAKIVIYNEKTQDELKRGAEKKGLLSKIFG